jgi:hypothetical protein
MIIGGMNMATKTQRKVKAHSKVTALSDGKDFFITVDGVKIAKRGRPDTPQAMTWISLEPGWSVVSSPDHATIAIKFEGVRVH